MGNTTAALVSFSGAEAFTAFEGNVVEPQSSGSVLVRSTRTEATSAGSTHGAFATIPVEQSNTLAGKTIEITVHARQASDTGSRSFSAAYSTASAGNSGWQDFDLGVSFAAYSFRFAVPAVAVEANNPDFIGIWADKTGSGKGVEVRSITVTVVPASGS